MREAEVSLDHARTHVPGLRVGLEYPQFLCRAFAVGHPVGAIDLLGDPLYFLMQGPVQIVEKMKIVLLLACGHHSLSQLYGPVSPPQPGVGRRAQDTGLLCYSPDKRDLLPCICVKTVDADDGT